MKRKTKQTFIKILLAFTLLFSFNLTKGDVGCSPEWPYGCPVYDIEYNPVLGRYLCYEGGSWHCSNPEDDEQVD